jgi:hypothetical protein
MNAVESTRAKLRTWAASCRGWRLDIEENILIRRCCVEGLRDWRQVWFLGATRSCQCILQGVRRDSCGGGELQVREAQQPFPAKCSFRVASEAWTTVSFLTSLRASSRSFITQSWPKPYGDFTGISWLLQSAILKPILGSLRPHSTCQ